MKLVQLLAKELKEWPEGAKYARQDFDGEICFVGGGIWSDFYASCVASDIYLEDGIGASQITEDQWQDEREKMNKPKWIRHRGGWMPVGAATIVEVRLRCGDIQKHEACEFLWRHKDCDSAARIMAYRIIEETKDQEIEEVESIDTAKAPTIEFAFGDKDSDPKDLDWKQLGALTYKLEIDAINANTEIDSLVAKRGQIESPLKWRDEIIELEAYEEEFRREREKLIRNLESEGFKLIDHVAPVYGFADVDMSDWRNWQDGDIVECLIAPDKHEGYYFSGINYKINAVDLDDERTDCEISVYCKKAMSLWCPSSSFKFIRRP